VSRFRGRALVAAATLAALAVGALASLAASRDRPADGSKPQVAVEGPRGTSLADPPPPAFQIPTPRPLRRASSETTWAPVRRATAARSAPGSQAPLVARLAARTPEGTTNVVLARGRARAPDGSLWIEVEVPGRPGATVGWVPRRALGGYGVVATRLVVDLGDRRATLFRRGRVVFRADVGIGTPAAPTPVGRFYIRNKLTRYRSPFYGPVAFGTSVRSPTLTDWPAGGFVGIHGTNRPELIPGRVSHGCIRLRNEDLVRLARLMPVGTPLTIRA
jgi:L,D-transpeptidase catalytic domain